MKPTLSFMIIILLISGCSLNDDTLKIGSILILSGEGSSWGTAEQHGIDMAIQDLNNQGGVLGKKLSVLHQDDSGDPKKALSSFTQLVDANNVKFIIGTTWSRTGLALVDPAKEKQIVIISPSLGVKEFNEASNLLFNTWPHDFILSSNLADYVFNKGHRRVALIGAEEVWVKDQTNAFVQRFGELGGTIAIKVEPLPTDTTVSTEVLKIAQAAQSIDAIVSTTDGVLVGTLIAKGLKAQGVNLPLYSITLDDATIAAAEGSYEGMEFLTFLTPDSAFKENYASQFHIPLDIGADTAYDAVMMLAMSIEETQSTDPLVVAQYLNSIAKYDGVSGTLVSDGKGGFTKPFAIKKIREGRAEDNA